MDMEAPLPSLDQLRENAAECIRLAEAERGAGTTSPSGLIPLCLEAEEFARETLGFIRDLEIGLSKRFASAFVCLLFWEVPI